MEIQKLSYYQKNRDRIIKRVKTRYNTKKEEICENYRIRYRDDADFRKAVMLKTWRRRGVIGDLNAIYNTYLNCNACMICKKDFNVHRKVLDHDHETGIFRNVLCYSCNNKDNWRNYIQPL